VESRPTKLSFGSFLVYPSTAPTDESRKFKQTVLDIKGDRYDRRVGMRMPEYAAKRLAEELPGSPLEGFFQGSLLIPLPRSGLTQKHSLWPAQRICEELVRHGLASRFEAVIERRKPVRKSAGSADRLSPQEHFESLELLLPPPNARCIVLVDDVITRGSTALGAAWRLLERLPEVEIKAFAVARTVPAEQATRLVDIRVGMIELEGANWLTRSP
jgi:hypothetical protein